MKLKFATLLLTVALFGPGALGQNPNEALYHALYDGRLLHRKGGMLFPGQASPALKGSEFQQNFDDEVLAKPIQAKRYTETDIFPRKSHYLFTKWDGAAWFPDYQSNVCTHIENGPILKGDVHGTDKNSFWFKNSRDKKDNGGNLVYKQKLDDLKNPTGVFVQAKKKGELLFEDEDKTKPKYVAEREMFVPTVKTNFDIAFNEMDPYVWDDYLQKFACIDRKSFGGTYEVLEVDGTKTPFNPKGPTGISGKSSDNGLWRLGVNHAVDPVVMRRVDDNTFEVVVTIRRNDKTVAIPGGMVDPGTTFGRTLLKELGEEAIGLDKENWDKLSIEEQTDELIEYMHKHFEILMLYKGYSDDPRNTDNMWIDTQAALYMDTSEGNSASGNFKTRAEDAEGHTEGTFWMKMKKAGDGTWTPELNGQEIYASHNFFLQEACTYAEMCFNYDGKKLVETRDQDGKCQRRRQTYKNAEAKANQDTEACQAKSRQATCCLWNGDCENVADAVKNGLTEEVRNAFKEGHKGDGYDIMESYEKNKEEWQKKCRGETAQPSTGGKTAPPSTGGDEKSGGSALGGNLFMMLVAFAVVLAMAL